MTKLMAVKMRQLLSQYTPNIVEEAVKNKKDILSKNYIEKGWNYCYAIIENEVARHHAGKQKQKELYDNNTIELTEVNQDKQNNDNIDITEVISW